MLREINERLFKVKNLNGLSYYVEASSEEELFIFVADKVSKGAIISSVTEVCLDGSTPKVRVLSDKKFKKILKDILDSDVNPYANKLNENPYADFDYRIQDAKNMCQELGYSKIASKGDYMVIANRFIDNHDCNVSDNDQLEAIIEDYFKHKGDKK